MRYLYLVISEHLDTLEKIQDRLTELGQEGWRLIQLDGSIMYFIKEVKDNLFFRKDE